MAFLQEILSNHEIGQAVECILLCGLPTKFSCSEQKTQLTSSFLNKLRVFRCMLSKRGGRLKEAIRGQAAYAWPCSHGSDLVPMLMSCHCWVCLPDRKEEESRWQRHPLAVPALLLSFLEAQFRGFCSHFPLTRSGSQPPFTQGWPIGTLNVIQWEHILKRIYIIVVCKTNRTWEE